jgi:transposase
VSQLLDERHCGGHSRGGDWRHPVFWLATRLVCYLVLNPRIRQSGIALPQHRRISKVGRSRARAMLVEAAWAATKAAGPLRAFFIRIYAPPRPKVAAVAIVPKLAVLSFHLLTKQSDYLWPA